MRRPSPISRPLPWFPTLLVLTTLSNLVLQGTRVLVSYRALALGGGAIEVGAITAAYALLPLLVALPIGRAVDRGAAVPTTRLGLFLAFLAILLCAWSPGLIVLGLANALLGVGQMLYTVAGQAVVPMWSPPASTDSRFGNLSLAISAGQFVGYPIAGFLASVTDAGGGHVTTAPTLLMLAAVAAATVPIGYVFAAPSHVRARRTHNQGMRPSPLSLLRAQGMKSAIFSSMTVLTGMDLLVAYLPVVGQDRGMSVGTVSFLLTVRVVATMASRATLGRMLRRTSRRLLLVLATLVPTLPVLLVPLVSQPAVLAAFMVAIGFFWGIGQPLTMTWVSTLADQDSRATAMSVRLAGNRIAQVGVPVVAGGIGAAVGVAAVFAVTGLLLFASASTTFVSTRRTPPPEPST